MYISSANNRTNLFSTNYASSLSGTQSSTSNATSTSTTTRTTVNSQKRSDRAEMRDLIDKVASGSASDSEISSLTEKLNK